MPEFNVNLNFSQTGQLNKIVDDLTKLQDAISNLKSINVKFDETGQQKFHAFNALLSELSKGKTIRIKLETPNVSEIKEFVNRIPKDHKIKINLDLAGNATQLRREVTDLFTKKNVFRHREDQQEGQRQKTQERREYPIHFKVNQASLNKMARDITERFNGFKVTIGGFNIPDSAYANARTQLERALNKVKTSITATVKTQVRRESTLPPPSGGDVRVPTTQPLIGGGVARTPKLAGAGEAEPYQTGAEKTVQKAAGIGKKVYDVARNSIFQAQLASWSMQFLLQNPVTARVAAVGRGAYNFAQQSLGTTDDINKMKLQLFGALKSKPTVDRLSDTARNIELKSVGTYKDIFGVLSSLAIQPSLKPVLTGNRDKEIKRLVQTTQMLGVLNPFGMEGAQFIMQEMMSGELYGVGRRLNVTPELLLSTAGVTRSKYQQSNAVERANILGTYTRRVLGEDTLTQFNKTFKNTLENTQGYVEEFQNRVGKGQLPGRAGKPGTSFYDTVTNSFIGLNKMLQGFREADVQPVARQIEIYDPVSNRNITKLVDSSLNQEQAMKAVSDQMEGGLGAGATVTGFSGVSAFDALSKSIGSIFGQTFTVGQRVVGSVFERAGGEGTIKDASKNLLEWADKFAAGDSTSFTHGAAQALDKFSESMVSFRRGGAQAAVSTLTSALPADVQGLAKSVVNALGEGINTLIHQLGFWGVKAAEVFAKGVISGLGSAIQGVMGGLSQFVPGVGGIASAAFPILAAQRLGRTFGTKELLSASGGTESSFQQYKRGPGGFAGGLDVGLSRLFPSFFRSSRGQPLAGGGGVGIGGGVAPTVIPGVAGGFPATRGLVSFSGAPVFDPRQQFGKRLTGGQLLRRQAGLTGEEFASRSIGFGLTGAALASASGAGFLGSAATGLAFPALLGLGQYRAGSTGKFGASNQILKESKLGLDFTKQRLFSGIPSMALAGIGTIAAGGGIGSALEHLAVAGILTGGGGAFDKMSMRKEFEKPTEYLKRSADGGFVRRSGTQVDKLKQQRAETFTSVEKAFARKENQLERERSKIPEPRVAEARMQEIDKEIKRVQERQSKKRGRGKLPVDEAKAFEERIMQLQTEKETIGGDRGAIDKSIKDLQKAKADFMSKSGEDIREFSQQQQQALKQQFGEKGAISISQRFQQIGAGISTAELLGAGAGRERARLGGLSLIGDPGDVGRGGLGKIRKGLGGFTDSLGKFLDESLTGGVLGKKIAQGGKIGAAAGALRTAGVVGTVLSIGGELASGLGKFAKSQGFSVPKTFTHEGGILAGVGGTFGEDIEFAQKHFGQVAGTAAGILMGVGDVLLDGVESIAKGAAAFVTTTNTEQVAKGFKKLGREGFGTAVYGDIPEPLSTKKVIDEAVKGTEVFQAAERQSEEADLFKGLDQSMRSARERGSRGLVSTETLTRHLTSHSEVMGNAMNKAAKKWTERSETAAENLNQFADNSEAHLTRAAQIFGTGGLRHRGEEFGGIAQELDKIFGERDKLGKSKLKGAERARLVQAKTVVEGTFEDLSVEADKKKERLAKAKTPEEEAAVKREYAENTAKRLQETFDALEEIKQDKATPKEVVDQITEWQTKLSDIKPHLKAVTDATQALDSESGSRLESLRSFVALEERQRDPQAFAEGMQSIFATTSQRGGDLWKAYQDFAGGFAAETDKSIKRVNDEFTKQMTDLDKDTKKTADETKKVLGDKVFQDIFGEFEKQLTVTTDPKKLAKQAQAHREIQQKGEDYIELENRNIAKKTVQLARLKKTDPTGKRTEQLQEEITQHEENVKQTSKLLNVNQQRGQTVDRLGETIENREVTASQQIQNTIALQQQLGQQTLTGLASGLAVGAPVGAQKAELVSAIKITKAEVEKLETKQAAGEALTAPEERALAQGRQFLQTTDIEGRFAGGAAFLQQQERANKELQLRFAPQEFRAGIQERLAASRAQFDPLASVVLARERAPELKGQFEKLAAEAEAAKGTPDELRKVQAATLHGTRAVEKLREANQPFEADKLEKQVEEMAKRAEELGVNLQDETGIEGNTGALKENTAATKDLTNALGGGKAAKDKEKTDTKDAVKEGVAKGAGEGIPSAVTKGTREAGQLKPLVAGGEIRGEEAGLFAGTDLWKGSTIFRPGGTETSEEKTTDEIGRFGEAVVKKGEKGNQIYKEGMNVLGGIFQEEIKGTPIEQARELARQGVSPENIRQALETSGVSPDDLSRTMSTLAMDMSEGIVREGENRETMQARVAIDAADKTAKGVGEKVEDVEKKGREEELSRLGPTRKEEIEQQMAQFPGAYETADQTQRETNRRTTQAALFQMSGFRGDPSQMNNTWLRTMQTLSKKIETEPWFEPSVVADLAPVEVSAEEKAKAEEAAKETRRAELKDKLSPQQYQALEAAAKEKPEWVPDVLEKPKEPGKGFIETQLGSLSPEERALKIQEVKRRGVLRAAGYTAEQETKDIGGQIPSFYKKVIKEKAQKLGYAEDFIDEVLLRPPGEEPALLQQKASPFASLQAGKPTDPRVIAQKASEQLSVEATAAVQPRGAAAGFNVANIQKIAEQFGASATTVAHALTDVKEQGIPVFKDQKIAEGKTGVETLTEDAMRSISEASQQSKDKDRQAEIKTLFTTERENRMGQHIEEAYIKMTDQNENVTYTNRTVSMEESMNRMASRTEDVKQTEEQKAREAMEREEQGGATDENKLNDVVAALQDGVKLSQEQVTLLTALVTVIGQQKQAGVGD